MKKILVGLFVVGFVFGIAQIKQVAQAGPTEDLLDSAMCITCHNGEIAKNFDDYGGITKEKIEKALHDGVEGEELDMPNAEEFASDYGVELNPEEVEQLTDYIFNLNK